MNPTNVADRLRQMIKKKTNVVIASRTKGKQEVQDFRDCVYAIDNIDTGNNLELNIDLTDGTPLSQFVIAISADIIPKGTTILRGKFSGCTNLNVIPMIRTSDAIDLNYMFYNCTNLALVPELDLSSAQIVTAMFSGCTSLTNESLNNIMLSLTKSKNITSEKTLKGLGFSEEQATTCTALSAYQTLTETGWTTGY